ncbi:MAG: putative glycolipid-binding domain-containing protein [Rhodocyclaceae bacterium]
MACEPMNPTAITALWRPWTDLGLEHLRVINTGNGTIAEGTIVRVLDARPFRAAYRITCDQGWRFRRVELRVGTDHDRCLTLVSDGLGHWHDDAGTELDHLRGCFEIDISATPFTNTLAIGRLGLAVGQSADICAAYIRLPALTVEAVPQRYTCVERGETQSAFKYEGLFRNFTAVLRVDANLLVTDYPETFHRVHASGLLPAQA